MHEHSPIANPFELMMNPEAVLQAMARSGRLELLQRRICRPLDKPVLSRKDSESATFDKALEDQIAREADASD